MLLAAGMLLVGLAAIVVGVVILVPGLVGLGRCLSAEISVDIESPESVATSCVDQSDRPGNG